MKPNEVVLQLSVKQLTYVRLAVKCYKEKLEEKFREEVDIGDLHHDLLIVESIQRLLDAAQVEAN